MATKKITEVDVVTNISDNDFYFINQGGALKQIKKTSIPKPAYTANEVGALPDTTKALPCPQGFCVIHGANRKVYDGSADVELHLTTLEEAKQFLGI